MVVYFDEEAPVFTMQDKDENFHPLLIKDIFRIADKTSTRYEVPIVSKLKLSGTNRNIEYFKERVGRVRHIENIMWKNGTRKR
ncbi:hypothetical protein [Bacillus cereus]|uniref:hypothetical protein n=1 Tax=Bacillus cereus TaxID=1396 RepID=UPI001596BCA2|nr:hypothetical protein [Bacillus cereus]